MTMLMQDFLRTPGMESVIDTAEQNLLWNKGSLAVYDFGGIVLGTATDSGNTPTSTLRGGLLMGRVTATGKLVAWAATATDGSQNVYGVLPFDLNLLDVNATGQDRVLPMLIGGWVKNAAIVAAAGALTPQARQQMRGRFFFDDDFFLSGAELSFPFRAQQSKTANYTILSTDNGTLFDNTGAAGAITLTLPAIAGGYNFGFLVAAGQAVTISSNEGTNIVAPGNAAASNVAFTTPGKQIGAMCRLFTNPGGTLWQLAMDTPQAVTIS